MRGSEVTQTLRLCTGLGILLSGCAAVPQEAGFDEVQHWIGERMGNRLNWTHRNEPDPVILQVVRGMLEHELSVNDAVQIALLNNPELQATYEELGIAQADLVEAGLPRNPILSAEIRLPENPQIPFETDVAQDILHLLLIPLRKRAAEASFEASKLRVGNAVLDTAADVRSAFYRAQAAEQLLELNRTILQATEASTEAAQALREAGNITELEVARHAAMYEQARLDVADAEGQVAETREELNRLMGLWGSDTNWSGGRRLPDPPAHVPESVGLESLAVRERLDLSAARERIRALAQNLGVTRYAAFQPEISLMGHYEREPDGVGTAGPGIQMPIPIFNQGQPAVARAQAQLRQQWQRYTALAIRIRAEVRRAAAQMILTRGRAVHYRQVVLPLRQKIVDQAQLQFNAMQVGVFELLQAKHDQIEAGRKYVESLREYWVARAELARAVGGRLPAEAAATQAAGVEP